MHKHFSIVLAAVALTACQASAADGGAPASPEAEELKVWTRQLKVDDPDTARFLVRECGLAGAFGSADGKLATMRCMHQKYDKGVRAGS